MNEWHIGDPVDWGDGWMDAQNWGHGHDGRISQRDCSLFLSSEPNVWLSPHSARACFIRK